MRRWAGSRRRRGASWPLSGPPRWVRLAASRASHPGRLPHSWPTSAAVPPEIAVLARVEGAVVDACTFQAATGASDAAMADLQRYRELLVSGSERMNLVGPSALAEFWPRHAWDSAQLLPLMDGAVTMADVGAGSGFPGVVLAILLKGRPGARVHLIESLAKRCGFLREVADALELPAEVQNARAEALDPPPLVAIVTARACAPLPRLFGYALPLMRSGARGLFLKGRSAEAELAEARRDWRVEATLIPSRSDPSGRIVRVERLSRARR